MAYGDFKDLARRTGLDKVLRDKAFNIAKKQNMLDINVDLLNGLKMFSIKRPLFLQINLICTGCLD